MSLKWFFLLIIVTLATYVLHEGAHWAAGELLGYDMWVNINSAGLVSGTYKADWHSIIVSLAGPLVTILQAIIAFVILKKHRKFVLFAIIFAAFMMRFCAMMMSVFNANDEAKVSEWLGLGPWTLYGFVVIGLLLLTIKAGQYLKLRWPTYLFAYIATSIGITICVMSEAYIPNIQL